MSVSSNQLNMGSVVPLIHRWLFCGGGGAIGSTMVVLSSGVGATCSNVPSARESTPKVLWLTRLRCSKRWCGSLVGVDDTWGFLFSQLLYVFSVM